MEWQIAQLKAIRLYAKMELGKRTSAIQGASGGDRRSDDFQKSEVRNFENTSKKDQLTELGLSKQRANENEKT
ncbi:MAG: hypothetical protein IJV40_07275 [Oscillospiraceae bacterium]|nr:hypothetical protein [Oscillospiraceae bacterium]